MPPGPASSKRFLPHAVLATLLVMALPALAVSAIETEGRPWLVFATVLLAMAMSVGAAGVGAAIWKRRPESRDLVFGDLMLWGWLRRIRAERRLARAQELLGDAAHGVEGKGLSRERRCEILEELGTLLEARDAYTHGHTRRVTRHSERIAREMGLPPGEVAKIRVAAAVHDVGKVHTPREVLTKPDRLTDEEFAIIKRHPVDGAEMAAAIGDSEITAMVRHHHERLDGGGYPDGLAGESIPLGARIIAVADTFDAMTSSRPYRPAQRHKKALDVLSREAGSQLDHAPVAAFQSYYSGRTSVAWSAFLVTAPQRFATWAGSLFQGASAGAAPLAQGIAAMGAAALIGTSLGSQAAGATAAAERAGHEGNRDGATAAAKEGARKRSAKSRQRSGDDRQTRKGPGRRMRGRGDRTHSQAPGPEGRGERPGSGGAGSGSGPGGGSVPGGGSGGNRPPDRPSPVPNVDVPKVDVPKVDVPKVDVPKVDVPKVDVPSVEVPSVDVPSVDVPKVDVPTVDVPRVELPKSLSPPQLP